MKELELHGPRIARRSLAAECSRFLLGPYTEVWDPYRLWIDELDPHLDDIISFNYDCVVEIADRLRKDPKRRATLFQIPPHVGGAISDDRDKGLSLFKLHGSANWTMSDPAPLPPGWDSPAVGPFGLIDLESAGAMGFHAALLSPDLDVGIAPPGGAKQAFVEENTQSLWDGARGYLRSAEEVVFLGYSFPATDERAKQYLLENIGAEAREELNIHVVLGSDTSLPGTKRLVALLATIGPRLGRTVMVNGGGTATGSGTVRVWTHAMGAEDFIRQPTFHKRAKRASAVGNGVCRI